MRYLLLLGIWFIANTSFAQDGDLKQLNALHKEYNERTTYDTVTISMLLRIASWHLENMQAVKFPRSKDSVFYYGNKAITLSQKLHYAIGTAKTYLIFSRYYYYIFDDEKTRRNGLDALNIFEKAHSPHGIADACTHIATAYNGNPGQDNIKYALRAKELYNKLKDKVQEGYASRIISEIYYDLGDQEKALTYAKESMQLFVKADYRKKEYVNTLLFLGVLLQYTGDIDEALKNTIEAVKVAEKLDPEADFTAGAYAHLARLYSYAKKQEDALGYLKKADKIASLYTDQQFMIMNSANIAQVLMDLNRDKEAIIYLKKLERYKDIDFMSQISLINKSILAYINVKEMYNAKKYVADALKILSTTKESQAVTRLYMPLARYYFATGQYGVSRKYFEKNKAWAQKANNKYLMQTIYGFLFKIDSIQSNFKSAVDNLKLSQMYKDSIFNEKSVKRIDELKVQYDVDKKNQALALREKDNKLLVQKNELQDERLTRSNLVRNISIIGIVIFAVFIGLLYYRHQKDIGTNKILQQQQSEIKSSNYLLQNLVAEKEWLLKEIHHRVKNNLHIIMSLLNSQSYFLEDDEARAAIQNSQHRIQSMSLIHQKLYMSDNLAAISMPAYVSELVDYLSDCFNVQKKVRFNTTIEDVEMDVSQAVPVGLILNEAITNCFKYAFPDSKGNVNVSLTNTTGDTFSLEIADDGVGFPVGFDITKTKSLGMKLIKGLSQDLDGVLDVNSGATGTSIKIEFAYKQLVFENAV